MRQESRVGFLRPFNPNLAQEIGGMVQQVVDYAMKKPGGMCPHRARKNSLDQNQYVYGNALIPQENGRFKTQDGQDISVDPATKTYKEKFQFGKQEVTLEWSVFKCDVCGEYVSAMRVEDYAEYVNTVESTLRLLNKLLGTELYYRTGFEAKSVTSGNQLLTALLIPTGDIGRFSRLQFGEYVKDYQDKYTLLKKELIAGTAKSADGLIDPSIITDAIQINTQQGVRYDQTYGGGTPVVSRDMFMREMVQTGNVGQQQQPTMNIAPPVVNNGGVQQPAVGAKGAKIKD